MGTTVLIWLPDAYNTEVATPFTVATTSGEEAGLIPKAPRNVTISPGAIGPGRRLAALKTLSGRRATPEGPGSTRIVVAEARTSTGSPSGVAPTRLVSLIWEDPTSEPVTMKSFRSSPSERVPTSRPAIKTLVL